VDALVFSGEVRAVVTVTVVESTSNFHVLMLYQAMTFQGLMPYYFQVLYPGRALELNHCVWNNNNFSPRPGSLDNCDPYQEHCEDCRVRPIETIGLVHYTLCYKPWFCYVHDGSDSRFNQQCQLLVHEWFKTRSEMERSWGRTGRGKRRFQMETFLGYCSRLGIKGYQPIEEPFGKPLIENDSWFAFVLWS
jgi:hypothetical protein